MWPYLIIIIYYLWVVKADLLLDRNITLVVKWKRKTKETRWLKCLSEEWPIEHHWNHKIKWKLNLNTQMLVEEPPQETPSELWNMAVVTYCGDISHVQELGNFLELKRELMEIHNVKRKPVAVCCKTTACLSNKAMTQGTRLKQCWSGSKTVKWIL